MGNTGLVLLLVAVPIMAQLLTGPPANPQYKYSTPMPPVVAVPDKVETSIGTLHLSECYPDGAATVEKIYDNLDRSRALQAYLLALPIVNQASMIPKPRPCA